MARGVGGHSPANIQKFLKGQHYPAKKADLIRTAGHNQAPKEVVDFIKGLHEDEFDGPQDVMKAYGEESREDSGHSASHRS